MERDTILKSLRETIGYSIRKIASVAKIKTYSLILDYEAEKECYARFVRYLLILKHESKMTNQLFLEILEAYSGYKKAPPKRGKRRSRAKSSRA